MRRGGAFVPAPGLHRLTRFYDQVVALTTRERTSKARLLGQLDPGPGKRLLDLGCGTGTGTLAIAARRRFPRATVAGVDADAAVLARARAKAAAAGADVAFDEALAQALPYEDGAFRVRGAGARPRLVLRIADDGLEVRRPAALPGVRDRRATVGAPSTADRHVRFVLSNEPVERLALLGERVRAALCT